MKELLQMARRFVKTDSQRYATLEGNRDCNRQCSYCDVPNRYTREGESSLDDTFRKIDWLYDQGFRLISYIGGEPLAPGPYITKEGMSFFDHTREVVRYAHKKGAVIGVTTNGDFVTEHMIRDLAETGLDSLTFSLHSLSREQVEQRVNLARAAAQAKIIPTVNTVLTTRSADIMPALAAYVAKNGVPFSFGLVQEKGGGFSRKNRISLVPPLEEQKRVFHALLRLKHFGFVRSSSGYLKHAVDYYPNNWRCNPSQDSFIHIDAVGNVNVCSDVRTGIKVGELGSLSDGRWRDTKKTLVESCGNCLYQCYYDSENPDTVGHIPFAGVAMLIKTGNAGIAEKWGQFAVEVSKRMERNVNWELGI